LSGWLCVRAWPQRQQRSANAGTQGVWQHPSQGPVTLSAWRPPPAQANSHAPSGNHWPWQAQAPPHTPAHSFRKKISRVTRWLEERKIPEHTQKQVQVSPPCSRQAARTDPPQGGPTGLSDGVAGGPGRRPVTMGGLCEVHTQDHPRAHSPIHACTHAHAHACMHARTRARECARTLAARTHTRTHARMLARTHADLLQRGVGEP